MDNNSNNHGRMDNDEELQSKGIDIERIRNARKRRINQLKRWNQYDKSKEKEELKGQKKGFPFRKGPKSVRFCQNLILLEAGNSGDADEVRRLLSEGVCADVANGDGLTALHQCVINNNIDMCRILVHYHANVNAKDKELWTPLHAAAICGHSEICQLLIKNGADLLALNTDGNMPYDICDDEVTLDIIENEMASKGITQEQINVMRNKPEQIMLSDLKAAVGRLGQTGALQLFCQLDKQGANQLHVAAACGYLEVAKLLISIGMPVDAVDKDGWQAIHVASVHSHLEIIELLVSNGANLDSHTKQGETVYELVFDPEIYEKLLLLKQEIEKLKENQNLTASVGLVRRRSSTNPRSASIRRTSMKDKSVLSWKEARQEAEIRLSIERKNPSENVTLPPNHLLNPNDNSGHEPFTNSSFRGKHFSVNDTIAEIDCSELEQSKIDHDQIEIDFQDTSKTWALPGLAKINEKPNFTHPHPYNSPTRDPDTFPYNPKSATNSNSNKVSRESVSKVAAEVSSKARESVGKLPEPHKPREVIPRVVSADPNKPKTPVIDKSAAKKMNTLPHTYQDQDEIIEAKPLSMRSNKQPQAQAKSPSTSHRQIGPPRSSVISTRSGSSHTTPIATPRSSEISDHRKPNRQQIKPNNHSYNINNNNNGNSSGNNSKIVKSNYKPDSCCSVM